MAPPRSFINQEPFYIGDNPWYQGSRGAMHSLCLHDDILSAAQVRSLYTHDTTTHDFLLIESSMPWGAARSECLALGRDLASVHGSSENDELGRVMGDSHVWIGATDASCPGTVNECWAWSDGSRWEYTNWRGGEPNVSGGSEDCGQLYVTGGDHGASTGKPGTGPAPTFNIPRVSVPNSRLSAFHAKHPDMPQWDAFDAAVRQRKLELRHKYPERTTWT
jgi:hypothetical protein